MDTHPQRIRPDKAGSVCLPFGLGPYLTVGSRPLAEDGAAVVCRVLSSRSEYGYLELTSGRQALLVPGDLIVGALGNRAALRGFSGRVPSSLNTGDPLHLLNQGGVIGLSDSETVGLGEPIRLEVVGTPLRDGSPLRLADFALEPAEALPENLPPVIAVAGTCMNAGKTTAAAIVIRHLRGRGLRVHAGKATGVACIRDLLRFGDNGAAQTLSFLDCGLASTCYRDDVPAVTRTLLSHLAAESPEVIVLELGDGLLGRYGVDELIADEALARTFTGAILAANDVMGGWAAGTRLQELGIQVRVITGPATDNAVGRDKLEELGFPAANIFHEAERVCALATEGIG